MPQVEVIRGGSFGDGPEAPVVLEVKDDLLTFLLTGWELSALLLKLDIFETNMLVTVVINMDQMSKPEERKENEERA